MVVQYSAILVVVQYSAIPIVVQYRTPVKKTSNKGAQTNSSTVQDT